jgi:prevent-host-death family protein
MSEPISIHAAKTHLSRLIARAEAGEEIIIARGSKPVVKLVSIAPKPKRVFGSMRGQFKILRTAARRRTQPLVSIACAGAPRHPCASLVASRR